jgi:hypothetical protein
MTLIMDIFVRTTVVLICGAVLAIALRRASAAARHSIWIWTLLCVQAIPGLRWLLPPLNIPVATGAPAPQTPPSPESSALLPDEASAQNQPIGGGSRVHSARARAMNWPAIGWAVGFLAGFARMIAGAETLRRLVRNAKAAPAGLIETVEALRESLDIRKPVRLIVSGAPIT